MRRQLAALVFALALPLPALAADVVIQPGETLSEIAARAGISTQRLMQLNGLRDADRIVAGQRLTVPGTHQNAGGGNRGGSPAGGRITVRQGETLSEISERYGVSVERLMQLNGISDPTRLVAGDRLILRAPSSNRRDGSGGRAAVGGGGTTVTVRPGDTLSDIADRYNVPLERLVQLNRLQNPSQVMAGEKLLISTRPPTRSQRPGTSVQTIAGARVHVVQPGETLSDIATDYKVPMERLVSLNKIQDPDELVAGTRLRLTPPPPVPRSAPRATSRPKPKVTTPTVARSTPTRSTTATASSTTRNPGTASTATAVAPRATTGTVAGGATSPTRTASTAASGTAARTTTTTATTTKTATVATGTPAATTGVPASTTTANGRSTPSRSTSPAETTATTTASTNPATAAGSTGASRSTTAAATPSTTTSASAAATTATRTTATTTTTAATSPARAAGSAGGSRATTAAATPSTTTTASAAATTAARTTATATTTTAGTAGTPATTRAAETTTVATASQRPASTSTATAPRATTRTRAVPADWRTYGPMQVDWSSWQNMGGSYVAPVLTGNGQPFYLAINCGARKLNTTGASGQWKTWEAPQTEFEQSLVTDLCKIKGS